MLSQLWQQRRFLYVKPKVDQVFLTGHSTPSDSHTLLPGLLLA